MVERLKTKYDIRKEIEDEINRYLESGGEIQEVQQGISGKDDNSNLNSSIPFSEGQQKTRTLVNDTIKAIDERKQKNKPSSLEKKHPKRKIIYDDFGEPIREIWE